MAQATHANIVQVYAISTFNGLHYMALEYVDGRNLRQFLEKKGPPEVMLALSIIRQVAAALQRAAELGIVHRDIKPENILLTRKGEVKVADFGLSRFFGDDTQALNLTQSGVTLGTPLYMSPEQVEGKEVDPRTDIYSFGITCYHLLAGTPPFRGTSAFDVAVQHVQKQAASLAQIRPDLPAELCGLVHRMMAKKPDERIQTGREIVREVARIRDALVAGGSSTAVVAPVLTGGGGGDSGQQTFVVGAGLDDNFDATLTQTLPSDSSSWVKPWMLWLAAAATVFLALTAGLGYGWLRSGGQPAQASSAAADEPPPPPPPSAPTLTSKEKLYLDMIKTNELERVYAESLNYRIKLGLYYLHEWKLAEAERTFTEMESLDKERQNMDYGGCGMLGKAMVLAFKDEPRASNKLFEKALPAAKAKGKAKQPPVVHELLRKRPEMAEMVAKALNYNLANARAEFPAALRIYLAPPAARVKEAKESGIS